ncbi:MAG TPA: hypothetical protein VM345_13960 [Acidimicrobiales bacterium]|jgi:hypothetical protein|nr:hypothetical protein [Acidimicrobiales bacterium]
MARPSSTKKVSRAAQTGGGRTTRGSQSWLYWALIAAIVVLGVVGVGVSREQRRDELAAPAGNVPPLAGRDHWHTAYGIYICDQFIDPITDQRDPEGIHTHADGVIHVHPIVRRAAGRNAKLGKFFDAVRLDLDDTKIEVPGGKTYREGDDECDGEPGIMQLKVKGREEVITTDIADFVFSEDRQVITIAFAPKGADIPLPPSEATLDNLSDVEPAGDPASVPPATNPDGTPVNGGDETSTTVEGDGSDDATTTTAAP